MDSIDETQSHEDSDGAAAIPPTAQANGGSHPAGEPEGEQDTEEFDFEAHRRQAVDEYEAVREGYEECAQTVRSVLRTVLQLEKIETLSVDARAKEVDSFGRKTVTPSEADPTKPKYLHPLEDITDLSGARVITYLLRDVQKVNRLIDREFEIVEKSEKSGLFEEGEKLGYQSTHFLVRFNDDRCALPEYERFKGRITEIQVRTVLQHAWAEIEHDIQYKAISTIPDSIRRRFMSLAGMLEIGDREFQAISDEDEAERSNARRLVALGQLNEVQITPDALKAYLDRQYGGDGRMSPWTYEWTAQLVRRLGFDNLGELNAAVAQYDDDKLSRIVWGTRQGQVTRFETVLLAALGELYSERRGYPEDWRANLVERDRRHLTRLKDAGVSVATYKPPR